MTNLREMNDRMQAWMNEKPQQNWGDRLSFSRGDVLLGYFCSSGSDGDALIKIYKSHMVESRSKNGVPLNLPRYCPKSSGQTEFECPLCAQGHTDIKERMSMWFYVVNLLHTTQPQDKQLPQVQFEGNAYFNEEVQGFRRWDASAWRESPWSDIVKLNEMYATHGGLHGFMAQMVTVGDNLQRRYKLYAYPNSQPFTQELYERAKRECKPIPETLKEEINSPVQAAPAQSSVGAPQPSFGNWQPSGGSGIFTPLALPVQTAAFTPGLGAPTTTPAPVAATETPQTPAPAASAPPAAAPAPPAEETNRPMRSMF